MGKRDYYIGLDVGTESVGWAVTNTDYRVLNAKGKALWGIHLFEEASNKDAARSFRTTRRRQRRKKWRLKQLQDIFEADIMEIDPQFFRRLEVSFRDLEDKAEKGIETKFSLFQDENFTDITYHKNYPTIHHLLVDLMKGKDCSDPRLVYLAIAYMFNHRGHFLFNTVDKENVADVIDITQSIKDLEQYMQDTGVDFRVADTEAVKKALQEKGVTGKQNALKNIIECSDLAVLKEIRTLISGGSADISKLLLLSEEVESLKCNFSNQDFDTIEENLIPVLGDEFELIRLAKLIYDGAKLQTVLGEKASIAEAKVEQYTKHGKDLKKLKDYLKSNSEAYKQIFKSDKEGSYASYVKHLTKNGKKSYIKGCSK